MIPESQELSGNNNLAHTRSSSCDTTRMNTEVVRSSYFMQMKIYSSPALAGPGISQLREQTSWRKFPLRPDEGERKTFRRNNLNSDNNWAEPDAWFSSALLACLIVEKVQKFCGRGKLFSLPPMVPLALILLTRILSFANNYRKH